MVKGKDIRVELDRVPMQNAQIPERLQPAKTLPTLDEEIEQMEQRARKIDELRERLAYYQKRNLHLLGKVEHALELLEQVFASLPELSTELEERDWRCERFW